MSTIRVGGLLLADFSDAGGELDQRELAQTVRDAGYAIVSGKGYTSYGVATAIVRICEAIVRDERIILPVSTRVDGVLDRKSTRLTSSHYCASRMPSSD